jgi:hypothetical protein
MTHAKSPGALLFEVPAGRPATKVSMLGVAAKLERRRIVERTARGRADAKPKGASLLLGRWWLGPGWMLAAPAPGRRYLSGMADPHEECSGPHIDLRRCGAVLRLLSFRSAQYYVTY